MLKKFRNNIRNKFIAGLLVIVPVTVTGYLFWFLLNKFDQKVSPATTRLLVSIGIDISEGYRIPGLGFAVVVLIILFAGFLTTGIIGKKIIHIWENIVAKIPFAGNIYTGAKQIVEAVTLNRSVFSKVVVIEYPRRGLFSIGFVTCESPPEIQSLYPDKMMVNVFVPTTPNPTSGVLIFLPKDEVSPLSLSVEEGIKLVVSGGIVSPEKRERIAREEALSEIEKRCKSKR